MKKQPSGRGKIALTFLGVSSLLAVAAVATLSASSPDRPASPRGLDPVTQAKVAFMDREFERAEKILREMIAGGSEDRNVKALLGRVLCERGRLMEARDIFGALVKLDPTSYEATRGLAVVYEGLGQPDLAVIYFERAASLKRDAHSLRELGLAQHRKGDSLGALSSIQQSLALDGNQADLSQLVSEIAVGKSSFDGLAGGPKIPGYSTPTPRAIDPDSLIPKPQVPDPTKMFPQPGRKTR